jgi:hypothetical protein
MTWADADRAITVTTWTLINIGSEQPIKERESDT